MIEPRIALIAALRDQLPDMDPLGCVHLADALIGQLAQDGVRLIDGRLSDPPAGL
ncbi:hypothetical protein [Streptomyces regalis]|uniref:hypothetical protein n=1 Tax=Streptomyces regalis TaxID=68262 RepID=UPI000A5AB0C6|nr:hypothetical protein [Streptomyces regalis]